jgi:hypothetical protein
VTTVGYHVLSAHCQAQPTAHKRGGGGGGGVLRDPNAAVYVKFKVHPVRNVKRFVTLLLSKLASLHRANAERRVFLQFKYTAC